MSKLGVTGLRWGYTGGYGVFLLSILITKDVTPVTPLGKSVS